MRPDKRSALFDAHLHIIDAASVEVNHGWSPEPFTTTDYRARIRGLNVALIGGAIVAGSFQNSHPDELLRHLDDLGAGFVVVLDHTALGAHTDLGDLHERGVRAVRFNLRRAGPVAPEDMTAIAHRVFEEAGWHTEVYATPDIVVSKERVLAQLPSVVIDHLGLCEGIGDPAFAALIRLVGLGAKVKATGFGRITADPAPMLSAIVDTDPRALLFGTDLPSTRSPRPFDAGDLDLVRATVGPDHTTRALSDNALELYRPDDLPGRGVPT